MLTMITDLWPVRIFVVVVVGFFWICSNEDNTIDQHADIKYSFCITKITSILLLPSFCHQNFKM